MEKRACKRIPADIAIEYDLWNPLVWKKHYTGTIKNLSERGMFISTRTINFPLDSLLEISILYSGDIVFLPAKISTIIWRRILPDNSCDSIGVEILNPPRDYLEFVSTIESDGNS